MFVQQLLSVFLRPPMWISERASPQQAFGCFSLHWSLHFGFPFLRTSLIKGRWQHVSLLDSYFITGILFLMANPLYRAQSYHELLLHSLVLKPVIQCNTCVLLALASSGPIASSWTRLHLGGVPILYWHITRPTLASWSDHRTWSIWSLCDRIWRSQRRHMWVLVCLWDNLK